MDNRKIALSLELNTKEFEKQYDKTLANARKKVVLNSGITAPNLRSNSSNQKVSVKVNPVVNVSIDTKSIVDELKGIRHNTKKSGIFSSALKATGNGAIGLGAFALDRTIGTTIDGVLHKFSSQFASEFMAQQSILSNGQSDNATRYFAKKVAGITQRATVEYADILFGVNKELPDAIEQVIEDVVNALENIAVPSKLDANVSEVRRSYFDSKAKIKAGVSTPEAEVQSGIKRIFAINERFFRNAAYRATQVIAAPAKFRKEQANSEAAVIVDKATNNNSLNKKRLAKDPSFTAAESRIGKEITKIVLAIGGFQRVLGKGGEEVAAQLEGLMDDATLVLSVDNRSSDKYKGSPSSDLFASFQEVADQVGLKLDDEVASTLSNIEVIVSQAFKGMNPDAIKAAIIAATLKKTYGDSVDVSALGFSGGGLVVEQMLSILDRMGIMMKGAALGTPFLGLTDTANPERFQSVLGTGGLAGGGGDEQAAFFDQSYLKNQRYIELATKTMKMAGGISAGMMKLMYFRPSALNKTFNKAATHSVGTYTKDEDYYNVISKLVPGFKKLGTAMDAAKIPDAIKLNHAKAIGLLRGTIPDVLMLHEDIRGYVVSAGQKSNRLNTKPLYKDGGNKLADYLEGKASDKDKRAVVGIASGASQNTREFNQEITNIEAKLGAVAEKQANSLVDYRNDESLSVEENKALKEKLLKDTKESLKSLYISLLKDSAFYKKNLARVNEGNALASAVTNKKLKSEGLSLPSVSEGLTEEQQVDLFSLYNKRGSDDKHLARTLRMHAGMQAEETGYEFYNEVQPVRKLETELHGGLIKYVTEPIAKGLNGTKFGEYALKYNKLLNTMSAALARYTVTGEKVPQAFIDAALKILESEAKLEEFEVPKIEGLESFETYSKQFSAGVASVANNLSQVDTAKMKAYAEQAGAKGVAFDENNLSKVRDDETSVSILDKTNNKLIAYLKSDATARRGEITKAVSILLGKTVIGGEYKDLKRTGKSLDSSKEEFDNFYVEDAKGDYRAVDSAKEVATPSKEPVNARKELKEYLAANQADAVKFKTDAKVTSQEKLSVSLSKLNDTLDKLVDSLSNQSSEAIQPLLEIVSLNTEANQKLEAIRDTISAQIDTNATQEESKIVPVDKGLSLEQDTDNKLLAVAAKGAIKWTASAVGALKAFEKAVVNSNIVLKAVHDTSKALLPYGAGAVGIAALPGGLGIQAVSLLAEGVSNLVPVFGTIAGFAGDIAASGVTTLGQSVISNVVPELPGFIQGTASLAAESSLSGLSLATNVATTGMVEAGEVASAFLLPAVAVVKGTRATARNLTGQLLEFAGATETATKAEITVTNNLGYLSKGIRDLRDKIAKVESTPYYGGKKLGFKKEKEFNSLSPEERVLRLTEQGKNQSKNYVDVTKLLGAAKQAGDNQAVKEVTAIRNSLGQALNTIQRKLSILGQDVKFEKPSVTQLREKLTSTEVTNTSPKVTKLNQPVNPVVNAAKDAFKKGKDLTDGFVAGFSNEIDYVEVKAERIGEAGVDGIAKGQNSNSPSKDAEEKGKDLVDGYTQGILKNAIKSKKAGEKVGKAGVAGISSVKLPPPPTAEYMADSDARLAEKASRRIQGIKPVPTPNLLPSKQKKDSFKESENPQDQSKKPKKIVNPLTGIEENAAEGLIPLKAMDATVAHLMTQFPQLGRVSNFVLTKMIGSEGAGVAKKALVGLIPIGLGVIFARHISTMVRALINFNKELEVTQQKLKTTGLNVASGSMFATFAKDANAAGQSVQTYANTLANLRAATKGKIGDPTGLTKEITQGFRKRGVVGDGADRALTGISQMASKGVVSMEELRQQISEALPGAMSIAAESMGKTEKEFNRLVSTGQIMSSDFLPQFAKALNAGGEPAENLTSSIVKLQNSFGSFKEGVVNVGVFKAALVPVNLVMKGLAAIAPAVGLALGSILAGSLAIGIKAIYTLVVASKAAQAGLLTLLKTSLISLAAIGVIAAGMQVFEMATGKSTSAVRKLADEMRELNKVKPLKPPGFKEKAYQSFRGGFGFDKVVSKITGKEKQYEAGKDYTGGNFFERNSVNWSGGVRLEKQKALEDVLKTSDSNRGSDKVDAAIASIPTESKAKIEKVADMRYRASNASSFDLSSEDASKLQLDAEKLSKELDLKLNAKLGIDTRRSEITKIEEAINFAQQEVDNGNDDAISLKTELEADLKQAKEEVARLAAAIQVESVDFKLGINANSKQEALQSKLTNFNTAQETALYKQMLAAGDSARLSEIKIRKLAVKSREEELRLTQETIKAQEDSINNLSSAQKKQLENALGSKVGSADVEAISRAKDTFSSIEASGDKIDPLVTEKLNQLEAQIGNRAKLNELEKDRVKDEYELKNAVRELKYEIKGLSLESANKAIEFQRFGLEASRFKTDKVNPIKFQAQDTTRQLAQSIRSQTLAYKQTVEGLKDFNHGIANATRDLATKMVGVARDMQVAAINGVNSYLGAAGIQDMLGLGRFREIITEAIGITQSDQRPTLTREKGEISRSFEQSQRDQKRSQEQMNVDVEGQIFDNNRRKEEALLAKERSLVDTKLDVEALALRRIELERGKEESNRNITSANQAAKEYGISERAGLITASVPMIDEADLAGTAAAMDAFYAEQVNGYERANSLLASIASKGNARINEELALSRKLHNEQMAMKDAEIAQDAARMKQAEEILTKKVDGTLEGNIRQLGETARETRNQMLSVKNAVADMMNGSGLQGGYYSQAKKVINDKFLEVDTKIAEFRAAKDKLQQFVDSNQNGEGSASNLLSQIDSAPISEEVKNNLRGQVERYQGTAEFKEVNKALEDAISVYDAETGKLKTNRKAFAQDAVNKFSYKYVRRNEDSAMNLAQANLDVSNVDDDSRTLSQAKLDYAKEEYRIQREMQDLLASGEAPEQVKAYGDALVRLNSIKLDKVQQELKWTTKMLRMAEQPLNNAFMGIGQAMGKSLANAVDTTAFQEKSNEINAQFGQDLLEIQEKYAGDPAKIQEATDRLQLLNEMKLDGVKNEFSLLGGIIGSLKDAVLDFASTLAQALIKKGVQKLIGSALGGVSFANGGEVNTYAKGGSVGCYVEGGIASEGIGKAIKKEKSMSRGRKPVVAVLHQGEQVLSTLNKDAQFFRKLQVSGDWDRLKAGQDVGTYANGGAVGSVSPYTMAGGIATGNAQYNRSLNVNNNWNIKSQDANSFKRSQGQIESRTNSRLKESNARLA